jgi:hypothetical protein
MRTILYLLLLFFFPVYTIGQKTLLVEKTGKSAKYYYHIGDKIKIRTCTNKTIIKGEITSIRDSSISVRLINSVNVSLNDITCVYKRYKFLRKFGIRSCQFGAGIFLVMVFNNLINGYPAFNEYVFIVSGAFLTAGLMSLALSERHCKIGNKWKLKILDGNLR